jgi:cytochrome c553
MCRSRVHLLLAYFAILILPASVLASEPTWDTCDECHGTDGMGKGDPMVPVIAGIPAEHIEEAIFAYVDGARRCVREPRMCETVAALSESEVAEVAEYYAGKERGSPGEEFDKDLAAEGGQRSEYLRFAIEAYFAGDRESLLEAMADKIRKLEAGDLGVLVNYYSSYRSPD